MELQQQKAQVSADAKAVAQSKTDLDDKESLLSDMKRRVADTEKALQGTHFNCSAVVSIHRAVDIS